MKKIYDFQKYVQKREDQNRLALGYSQELWDMMKELHYDVNNPSDIDQFFKDLEEE